MDIIAVLKSKLEKYGADEYICSGKELSGNWENNVRTGKVKPGQTDDLWIRSRLLPVGRIVEEDLENHTYTVIFEVGKPFGTEAFAVTAVENETLYVAAYAKDKMFIKGMAEKAVNIIISKYQEN